MNDNVMKKSLSVIVTFVMAFFAVFVITVSAVAETTVDQENVTSFESVVEDEASDVEEIDEATAYMKKWYSLQSLKQSAVGKADEAIESDDYEFTDEQIEELNKLEKKMRTASDEKTYNNALESFNTLVASCEKPEEPVITYTYSNNSSSSSNSTSSGSSSYSGSSNNFKSQGVVYSNGKRYTWYSSNVLYHYRTSEWTAGSDGFYRDSNGYLVVASDEYSQGSIVSTPWGDGIVLDSGAGSNTIDMYTNF